MSILASDNFNRADENLDAAPVWTLEPAANSLAVVSNIVVPTQLSSDCGAVYTGITWPNDHYSQAVLTVTGTAGGGSGGGLTVRAATGARTEYRFVADHAGSNNLTLDKFVAGVNSSVSGWPRTQAWTDGDTFRLEVQGTTLRLFINGVQVGADSTDASIASGSPGLGYSSTETAATMDTWEGGDFSGGGDLSATIGEPIVGGSTF